MAATTTTAAAMDESVSAHVPAFQTLRTRTWILVCFYTTVLLSLPYWHKTTTIERRALPYEQVQAWEAALPCPIRLRHTLTLRLPPDAVARENAGEVTREIARGLEAAGDGVWISEAERKAKETRRQERMDQEGVDAGLNVTAAASASPQPWPATPTPLEHAACIDWTVRLSDTGPLQQANSLHYIVTVEENGGATDAFLSTSTTRHFSIDAAAAAPSLTLSRPSELAWSLTSQLSRVLQLPYRDLFFQASLPTIGRDTQQQSSEAKETNPAHAILRRIDNTETDKRRIPYTRNVRLVFSLINEDASANDHRAGVIDGEAFELRGLTGVAGWDAREAGRAFNRRIRPLVEALQGTHEIATEMQAIWFAPLPFETKTLEVKRAKSSTPAAELDDDDDDDDEERNELAALTTALAEQLDTVHLIQRADLQIFVNAGEWGLSSGGASTAQGNVSVSGDVQGELKSMVKQNERTLHFIVYVPKPSHRPLRIAGDAEATTTSPTTAWLVPQWGGVALYNLGYEDEATKSSVSHWNRLRRRGRRNSSLPSPKERARQGAMLTSLTADELDAAFAAFARQLRSLLGLRDAAASVSGTAATAATIPSRDVRLAVSLDALLRRRIVDTVRESVRTLGSIVRLVDKIKILGVGREVQHDVRQALAMLERARGLNEGHDTEGGSASAFRQGAPVRTTPPAPLSPLRALLDLAYAGELLSARAFFNPAMLGQLYFPDEHKYAVYTPLFGPLAMPLLVAAIRLFKERRKARKTAADAAKKAAAVPEATVSTTTIAIESKKKPASKARKSRKAVDDAV